MLLKTHLLLPSAISLPETEPMEIRHSGVSEILIWSNRPRTHSGCLLRKVIGFWRRRGVEQPTQAGLNRGYVPLYNRLGSNTRDRRESQVQRKKQEARGKREEGRRFFQCSSPSDHKVATGAECGKSGEDSGVGTQKPAPCCHCTVEAGETCATRALMAVQTAIHGHSQARLTWTCAPRENGSKSCIPHGVFRSREELLTSRDFPSVSPTAENALNTESKKPWLSSRV